MQKLSHLVFILTLLAIVVSCSPRQDTPFTSGADEVGIAWEKISNGALLVDVRTPQEFQTGHLENAINIPIQELHGRLGEFGDDMDREIVLYCRTGRRAGLAAGTLEATGFNRVVNAGSYEQLLLRKP